MCVGLQAVVAVVKGIRNAYHAMWAIINHYGFINVVVVANLSLEMDDSKILHFRYINKKTGLVLNREPHFLNRCNLSELCN